mgnify:FL=1|jgi:hypothetical protein|tara:strand:- start:461 stop:682 length:222 start_codon:yes stop_codon:yes gene_type:complete
MNKKEYEVIARLVYDDDTEIYEIEWNHSNPKTADIFVNKSRSEAMRACDDGIADLTYFRLLLEEVERSAPTLH